MNNTDGSKIETEFEHIKQSITDILLTAVGSRIQRREYGSFIPLLLDHPINKVLYLQLAAASVMALKKWEPRIEIISCRIGASDTNQITADIHWFEKATQKQFNATSILR